MTAFMNSCRARHRVACLHKTNGMAYGQRGLIGRDE